MQHIWIYIQQAVSVLCPVTSYTTTSKASVILVNHGIYQGGKAKIKNRKQAVRSSLHVHLGT